MSEREEAKNCFDEEIAAFLEEANTVIAKKLFPCLNSYNPVYTRTGIHISVMSQNDTVVECLYSQPAYCWIVKHKGLPVVRVKYSGVVPVPGEGPTWFGGFNEMLEDTLNKIKAILR